MHELDPSLLIEMQARGRWVAREWVVTGFGRIALGVVTVVVGFLVALAIGGLDGISVLVVTAMVAGWALSTGARMVDQLVQVRLPGVGNADAV